jgi:hypothetical protein
VSFLLGFLIGAPIAGFGVWVAARIVFTAAAEAQIEKYRKRWLDALELMKSEGQISDAQLKEITKAAEPPAPKLNDKGRPIYRSMASWDRRDLEIERARAGLEPEDDLRGMASWDIRDVQEARIKYAKKRAQSSS